MTMPTTPLNLMRRFFLNGALLVAIAFMAWLIFSNANTAGTDSTIYFRSNPPLNAHQMEYISQHVLQYEGVAEVELVDAGRTLKVTMNTRYTPPATIRQTIECGREDPSKITSCVTTNL